MTSEISKVPGICFLLLFLYSCTCEEITCPGLNSEYSAWLPYKSGDVITYTNGTGQEIQFVVNRFEVSASRNLDCGPDGLGGCKCPNCPSPSSQAFAQTVDTTRKIVDTQGRTVKVFNNLYTFIGKPEGKRDSVFLGYYIFDHVNSIAIGPSLKLNNNDSLLPSYTIGNRTYSNVIVHQVDTTAATFPNPIYNIYFVWKSYYNREYGVIAFYDLKTRSFFYRKI